MIFTSHNLNAKVEKDQLDKFRYDTNFKKYQGQENACQTFISATNEQGCNSAYSSDIWVSLLLENELFVLPDT